jgi:cytochrome c biogenesis protein CcmG/thiol:disulfide interchange protein DsbE
VFDKAMLKYLVPLGLFVALVILLGVGLKLDPRQIPSPLIGKPAPAFTLPRLEAPEAFFDSEEFKGKVSLFNVFASWCLACRQEHPFLTQLARQGVTIYGLDYKDTREAGLAWIAEANPYTAVAFDETGKVAIDWGVYGVPETFVIDHQGIIRYKHIGPLTKEDWEQTLGPLVAELKRQAQLPSP